MALCTVMLAVTLCLSVIILTRIKFVGGSDLDVKTKIVIDTDAGTDDAVAILTVLGDAHYSQLVAAITCVRGNAEVDKVSVNVLKVLKVANRTDIPVYVGAAKGYMESPDMGFFFGQDGMGDANYPEAPPLTLLQKRSAAEFLAKIVDDYPGEVTILSLGPLTNIALATRLNPKFMHKIKSIIGLIGSVRGIEGIRPNVEFNAFMDPHAASVTMQELSDAGRKMTVIPTDTIRESFIDMQWRRSKLGAVNSNKVRFMNKIEKKDLEENYDNWTMFDVYVAVALLRREEMLEVQSYYVDFETQGQITKGVLVVDYGNFYNKTHNADVVTKLDKRVVKNVCLENLS